MHSGLLWFSLPLLLLWASAEASIWLRLLSFPPQTLGTLPMALAAPWKDCRHSTCSRLLHPLLGHEKIFESYLCLVLALQNSEGTMGGVYWPRLSLPKYSEPLGCHSPELVWDALWVSPLSTQDGKWGAKPFSRGCSNLLGVLVCPAPSRAFHPGWGGACRDAVEQQAGKASHKHLDAPDFSLQLPCCPGSDLISLLWGKKLQFIPILHGSVLYPRLWLTLPLSPFRNQNKTTSLSYS